MCVCVVLLASLHGNVPAFVSVLFAGQTVERIVKLATVKKDGSSLLLLSNARFCIEGYICIYSIIT